jgi:hypothetical protein
MGAVVSHQANFAGGDAESDEILSQQAHAQGRSVRRWELVRTGGRDPVLAHEITHRGPGTDATKQLIILFAQHEKRPPLASLVCPGMRELTIDMAGLTRRLLAFSLVLSIPGIGCH